MFDICVNSNLTGLLNSFLYVIVLLVEFYSLYKHAVVYEKYQKIESLYNQLPTDIQKQVNELQLMKTDMDTTIKNIEKQLNDYYEQITTTNNVNIPILTKSEYVNVDSSQPYNYFEHSKFNLSNCKK
jgi:uncharacterized protein YlxW (UPF0749 family)